MSNALCVAVEARKSMIIVLECVPKSDEEPACSGIYRIGNFNFQLLWFL